MKIAILGASGIGKFHARTFDKLSVEINSILNKKIKIEDPFEIYAARFINFCTNASNLQKDEFFESSHNLNLMAKILLKN